MSENVTWHKGQVTPGDRAGCELGVGLTIWLTGLSGSGKSTIAHSLEQVLIRKGRACYVLDGDNVRHGLNGDLGFNAADRSENIRRLGEVARLMNDAGLVVMVPAISPYSADRERVRRLHEESGLGFLEVFIDTPLEVCETRDPKGLYARARAGDIEGMTGIDDPYEAPSEPDIRIDGHGTSVAEATARLLAAIEREGPMSTEVD